MMDHPKLTARQQQILELIQKTIAETGAPPTRAEIANVLGFDLEEVYLRKCQKPLDRHAIAV
jgi:SOS-response transcriptional repressor LexA